MKKIVSLLCAALLAGTALAQSPANDAQEQERRNKAAERVMEKAGRETELMRVEDNKRLAAEARARLDKEVNAIKADRATLNATLIATATRARETETRMSQAERRLAEFSASETSVRASLDARREVIGEVLAALQRIGRRPPPAVIVGADDMLEAVRTAILMGAIVPDLRTQAEALVADLTKLASLRDATLTEKATLAETVKTLGEERERLASLVAARQQALKATEQTIGSEEERAARLATESQSLRDLIAGMERDIASSARAAESARRAAEIQATAERQRFATAAFKDPARLSPKMPFAETRGLLPFPVAGREVQAFGAADGFGGLAKGSSLATRAGSVVTAPSDGWVSFAGTFRSFGRLLILNVGGGYYILLSGMDRIDVTVGQFVLAGEPVAVMGESTPATPVAISSENNKKLGENHVLYIEFRKDGGSIDPGPWWAKTQEIAPNGESLLSEKVRG